MTAVIDAMPFANVMETSVQKLFFHLTNCLLKLRKLKRCIKLLIVIKLPFAMH